ncbi:MAG: PAS domain S-box protein, partial [Polyangiaceae bacterium]
STILYSIGDGVIATDVAGKILRINAAAQQLTGWSKDALGKMLSEVFQVVDAETRKEHADPVDAVLADRAPMAWANPKVLIAKDRQEHLIVGSAAPIRDKGNELSGVVLSFHDVTKEHEADLKVAEVENRGRRLVDALPFGVMMFEFKSEIPGDTLVSYANAQASVESKTDISKLVGRTLKESLAKDFTNGVEPLYLTNLRRVAKTGNTERFEVVRGARTFETHYVALDSKSAASIYHDVTDERNADQALRANEIAMRESAIRQKADERFRALVESAPDAMVMFSDDGRINLVNVETERLFGYDRAELLGRPIETLLAEEDRGKEPHRDVGYAASLRAHSLAPRIERNGRRKDGSIFPIEATLSALETDEGPTIAGAVRDITTRRKAEEQLRTSEQRYRLLVGAVKDYAIFMLDPTGHVTSTWNEGAQRIKGYTSKEIVGQHFSVFYPPEDIRDGKPERALKTAELEGRSEDDGWRLRKDGSRFLANVVITAVFDSSGKLFGFAKVTRDVTERHLAETALKHANRELEAFSYSVAHDLRSPLRAMNGFAQVLLDHYENQIDAEGRDWLQEILSNARRMGDLIDALLSLARTSRSELHPERVDLSAIARDAASLLGRAEPERSIDLIIAENLVAEVDPPLARAIFDNLLGNAWKFTQKISNARVEVGQAEIEGVRTFFVRDNGAGFDMAFASKLFAPFHRLHTDAEFSGTGIGLATVQRIVQRHGGRVWAEGHVDGGATFYFTLPGRLGAAAPGTTS